MTRSEMKYDINRGAAKISALSSGKIDKYVFFIVEEILPSDESQIIEQAKLTYSPLEKALEKQLKTIEIHGEIQIKAIEEHGKQLLESNVLVSNIVMIVKKIMNLI